MASVWIMWLDMSMQPIRPFSMHKPGHGSTPWQKPGRLAGQLPAAQLSLHLWNMGLGETCGRVGSKWSCTECCFCLSKL